MLQVLVLSARRRSAVKGKQSAVYETLDCKSFGGVPVQPVVLIFLLCQNSPIRLSFLDSDDLKAIKGLIETTIEEKELVTKSDVSHLPTKDEFYSKMDEVMGELKVIREEQPVQSHQLSDHEDRIEKIESNLGLTSN